MRKPLLPLLVLLLTGCVPRVVERVGGGMPLPTAPLVADLAAHNRLPRAVRVRGKLRMEGRGSAVFGGVASAEQGLRLDAVSGPFSRLLFSLACEVDGGCRLYMPAERRLLLYAPGAGEEWLLALVRGRVPTLGEPVSAWQLADGSRVLQLAGPEDWIEEVEFPPGDARPRRAVLSRAGAPRMEVLLTQYRDVEDHPFPGEIWLHNADDGQRYGFEFLEVLATDSVAQEALRLEVPPGTEVETAQGNGAWVETVLPLRVTAPGP